MTPTFLVLTGIAELIGALILLFFILDAAMSRPVYVRMRLVDPATTDYVGHHTPEWIGGRS